MLAAITSKRSPFFVQDTPATIFLNAPSHNVIASTRLCQIFKDSTAYTPMQKLRSIHLYLGCIFAPMLLFFALSGIWQIFGWNSSGTFQALSSIHTMRALKSGGIFLSSPVMAVFVLMMAVSFIITTILGVVMALKFGRNRRASMLCLAFGILFPIILVLLRLSGAT